MASRIKSSVSRFIDNFFKVIKRPDMVLLPGNLAFFFVLAIVPSVGLISFAASMLNLNTNLIFGFLEGMFSKDVADLVLSVSFNGMSGFKFVVTIVLGLYLASNAADCMITTTNAIYGIDNKSWILRRIKACGMTFMIIILLIFVLLVEVFGKSIVEIIMSANLNPEIINDIVLVFKIIEGPLTWLIMFGIIKFLYSAAPSGKIKGKITNYGAIFTTVMWIIGTTFYSYYATNYASYQTLYGGLANVVVLMIWLYYLSYTFTIGIALNYKEQEFILEKTGTIEKN